MTTDGYDGPVWFGLAPCGCPVAWSCTDPVELRVDNVGQWGGCPTPVVRWVMSLADTRIYHPVVDDAVDWRPEACQRETAHAR